MALPSAEEAKKFVEENKVSLTIVGGLLLVFTGYKLGQHGKEKRAETSFVNGYDKGLETAFSKKARALAKKELETGED